MYVPLLPRRGCSLAVLPARHAPEDARSDTYQDSSTFISHTSTTKEKEIDDLTMYHSSGDACTSQV
eukprot:6181593-Pleurochrysis_carterae.AAC.1